jgi:hypothetical protein
MKEWDLVRTAAQREVIQTHEEIRRQPDTHKLRQPENSRIYLITDRNPRNIARHYLRWKIYHIAVFFMSLALLPWLWRLSYGAGA